ncbi:25082_t:CDS:2, partial [Gigaspora rosea]
MELQEDANAVQYCYTVHPFSAHAKKCPYIHITEDNQVSQGLIQKNLDTLDIIASEDILDLTARRLITRVPISELHPSLNNKSKINHMIMTKRRAEHPYGQDIMG